MAGDAHFAIIASAHLATALQRFDRNLRLPQGLNRTDLDDLRNALEHRAKEEGRAQRKMSTRGADPQSQRWTLTAQGMIGDIVADELLLLWARHVYDELVGWDPPSPWASGQ